VAREAGAVRQQANQQSGWQAAGRVERLRSQALRPWWWWLLWRGQGRVERRGSPSARASPGARGGSAPLLDTLAVGGAGAGLAVAWRLEPAGVAGGLTRLAARGLGAVAWAPGATRVGSPAGLPGLALTCGEGTAHWPASPQANEPGIGAWKTENREEKSAPKQIKANGRRG